MSPVKKGHKLLYVSLVREIFIVAYKHRYSDRQPNEQENVRVIVRGPAHGVFKLDPSHDPWSHEENW